MKETIGEMKIQLAEWEKLSGKHASDKKLTSKINFKNSHNSIAKTRGKKSERVKGGKNHNE